MHEIIFPFESFSLPFSMQAPDIAKHKFTVSGVEPNSLSDQEWRQQRTVCNATFLRWISLFSHLSASTRSAADSIFAATPVSISVASYDVCNTTTCGHMTSPFISDPARRF
jgi:hypothetical protein